MSSEENAKPVKIDSQCIQDALRMYLQPIKNEDPKLDFYTMYKRETVEYDNEYMQKYNDDLNTTLIFAGLFSAVSSAIAIAIQPKLEPDRAERSEAYLRAIFLSLNRSISPDEDPSGPPVWSGPPQEIVTSLNLMYASLLISLLAAFVAMLGKQWLNRYLRHTGGSMIERCGERQRKFDGLEKWPFRLFIEGLPIMLQVALFLLACGLSRYMWSINASVAWVVISFTLVGFLFYIGIVIAGTYSYECPFQTPVSMALRHLKDGGATHRLLSSLPPLNILSLIHLIQKKPRKLLVTLSSLIYTAWVDSYQGLVSTSRGAYRIIRRPSTWEFSPSQILRDIYSGVRNVGRRVIIPLFKKFGNAKQRMAQGVRRFMRAGLLPTSTEDGDHEPVALSNGQGLRVRVLNLGIIRRRNMDDAGCVCWILRNITDPEALDAAVRLAGTIRWFDGNSDHEPPFDVIVSTFEACFDSAKQLYPGMRDRAYFSARAVLQINMRARTRSHEYASKYYPIPVPTISFVAFQSPDVDLCHVVRILGSNTNAPRPFLPFPESDNTRAHSLWLSNLRVDLTHAGPNPILEDLRDHLAVAEANHRPTVTNVLVMWYMLLGGHVEEETFWAVDKSDSLETILSTLSQKVMEVIPDGTQFKTLNYLFDFLAAWEERPASLTPMAYQWCSAISEVAGQLGLDGIDLASHIHDHLQSSTSMGCPHLLTPLKIAFRLVGPAYDKLRQVYLKHAPQPDQAFEAAFSSDDDEVIADAACAWIIWSPRPTGSCSRYFAKRVGDPRPFSPRLRQVAIRAIEDTGPTELTVSAPEVVNLLNRLDVRVGDLDDKNQWQALLAEVIRSPVGEILSSHHWRLLDELVSAEMFLGSFEMRDVEVMTSLEEAGNWEKLEVWMVIVWESPSTMSRPTPRLLEVIGNVTLKLLLSRPSALQRFEILPRRVLPERVWARLIEIRDQARAGGLPLEPQHPSQPVPTGSLVPLLFTGDDTFSEYATG